MIMRKRSQKRKSKTGNDEVHLVNPKKNKTLIEEEDLKQVDWLQCSRCPKWVKFDNAGLDCSYEEASDKSYIFICKYCNLGDQYQQVQQEIVKLRKDFDSLIEKVKQLENILATTVRPNANNTIPVEDCRAAVTETITDSRSRVKNLVVFNLPEFQSNDRRERIKYEAGVLEEIFKRLEIDKYGFRLVRLGKFSPGTDRPLLLLIEQVGLRDEVLKRTYKLKHFYPAGCIKPIFISPDRTFGERLLLRKLVIELKARRSRGENNLKIKDFKLVKTCTRRSLSFSSCDQGSLQSIVEIDPQVQESVVNVVASSIGSIEVDTEEEIHAVESTLSQTEEDRMGDPPTDHPSSEHVNENVVTVVQRNKPVLYVIGGKCYHGPLLGSDQQ